MRSQESWGINETDLARDWSGSGCAAPFKLAVRTTHQNLRYQVRKTIFAGEVVYDRLTKGEA